MPQKIITLHPPQSLRTDAWWARPLSLGAALVALFGYAAWAALQNANYYHAPYLSPFYSPCLASACTQPTASLAGSWWRWSPSLLVMWIPGGLRLTCYYYRKAFNRSFLLSPAACAVPDAQRHYRGPSALLALLQHAHRYFFYLSLPLLAVLWWDAIGAFRFADGFGIGLGSLLLTANAALLSLFTLSCNSCRHACGGHRRSFDGAEGPYRLWQAVSSLNRHHALFAWLSLIGVAVADLYVRALAMGFIADARLL